MIAMLTTILAVAAYYAKTRPRAVPLDECSELYRRYADCPGVEAAYIKDYRVNDTLTLCATVLEAQTDSAWSELQQTFHPIISDNSKKILNEGLDVLVYVPGTKCSDSIMADDDFAVVSLRDKYVCVFYVDDPENREIITNSILDRIFQSITKNQNFKKQ